MIRYEHRTDVVSAEAGRTTDRLNEALHRYEVLGWELVAVTATNPGYHPGYRLFFKRRLEDD